MSRPATLVDMAQAFSDMHKDFYGVRPSYDTSDWTIEDYGKEIEWLQDSLKNEFRREQEAARRAEEEYNRLAQKLNIKRSTLNRWLKDADKNMPLSGSNYV
ncbi:MAG: hypothetical protein CBE14_000500 [Rickettsiales bacterium TMED254]|nr:MAG: hypothetical protein CBE14_000500 [Rickettsiales bacterium TMED254]|tara:strand:- start:862 stop:1164 length:303 start_codon:yes stop_codon:yes gene_type:complete